MKVLILTLSAGQGHNSTAKAVNNVFTESGHDCKTLDICYEVNKPVGFTVDKGYLFSVNHLASLYSKTYTKLLKREAGKRDITLKIARYLSKKLRTRILDFAPDVIVCTHVFCGMVIKPYITNKEINAKTIGILTDYTLHPYWEETTFLDHIVVPAQELLDECLKKGYNSEQIASIGIPIQKKFSTHISKADARERLGLMTDKPVITVMSGSMCYGGLAETVKALDKLSECFQIIAICGSSKKELKKLQESNFRHKILKLGFVDEVNVIMDASDCIITKPGGISTAEAISRELPMILTKAIPGHEERNLQFLVREGAALQVTKYESIDKLLKRFLTDTQLRESMLSATKRLSRNDAATKLLELTIN